MSEKIPEGLRLPSLAARMVNDLETGDMSQYHSPQIEIVMNFLTGMRDFHLQNGDKAVERYLTHKCNSLRDILEWRNYGN